MVINPSDFNILVVDDIASNIILMKAILSREGYNVSTAGNGKDAISIIEKTPPDLLLLDVMMPQMDGFQVCTHIRNMVGMNDMPIILLTALNSNDDIVKGFSVGANDFVSKPFNNDVLLMRIKFQLSMVASLRIIKSQSEELEKIIKSRDIMYSIIAHDLRSPLATTRMVMNYVVDEINQYKLDSDIVDMLQNVNTISEDAFNLFDNLLKWTKSQTGRLNSIKQKVEISELVHSSIDVLQTVASSKGIDIEVINLPEKINVSVDIDMMKTVFRNIISNAIKFSKSGDKITIVISEKDEDNICIEVKDQGCGISPENVSKIMDGNIDFSTNGTSEESGSGLGLMLTRDFIERNGGKLQLVSQMGVGSTFSFCIPKLK